MACPVWRFPRRICLEMKGKYLLQDPRWYKLYRYWMFQSDSDQFHSNQRMLMVHKNQNFCSRRENQSNLRLNGLEFYVI